MELTHDTNALVNRVSTEPEALVVRVVRDRLRFAVQWAGDAPFRIGRGIQNDLVLGDPTVSGRHLVLERGDAEGITATDLGSRNGTWHDGTRLEGTTSLLPGERLRLGDATELVLVRIAVDAPPAPAITPTAHAGPRTWSVRIDGATARPSAVVLHTASQTELRFRPSHAATVLMMLAERATEATHGTGWLSDDDLRVGLWGRRGLTGDPNNLNVVLYRLRSRLRSKGIDDILVDKEAHRCRLLDARVDLQLSTRPPS